jgi:predicted metal-dependent phosphoesterase TrpH
MSTSKANHRKMMRGQPVKFRDLADLHMHSILSDGAFTVESLVDMAIKKGLRCIAITDHDNMDSYEIACKAAQGTSLEIIPGIEVSAVHEGKDIHILGYFMDVTNLAFNLELREQTRRRIQRVRAIIRKLNLLGIDITFEKVQSFQKGPVLGRPHIAAALIAEEYVSNFSEAFNKYLADGAEAFVEKRGISPLQAIRLIENAGGIAVLAHPFKTSADHMIEDLVGWGLKGIETYCHVQKGTIGKRYRDIAKQYNLVGSGGSDFHDGHSGGALGVVPVPYSVVEQLRNRVSLIAAEGF